MNPQRPPCFQPRGAARNGHGVSGAQAAFPSKALRKFPSSRPSSIVFTMLRSFFRASGNHPRRVRRPSCSKCSETSSAPQEISLVASVVHRVHNAPKLLPRLRKSPSSRPPSIVFTTLRNFFRASGNLPRRVRRPSYSQCSEPKKNVYREISPLFPLWFFSVVTQE